MEQDTEVQKIIAGQLKKLPKDIKEAIVSVDYQTKLQEIVKRQKLLIDQASKMETETTLVMLGLETLSDYTNNLQQELGIPLMRAKEIALDVSENVFKKIRQSLEGMNATDEDEGEIGLEKKAQPINAFESDRFKNTPISTSVVPMPVNTQIIQTVPVTTTSQPLVPPANTNSDQSATSLLDQKLKDTLMINKNTSIIKEESKLPPINKDIYKGTDPYKEPLI